MKPMAINVKEHSLWHISDNFLTLGIEGGGPRQVVEASEEAHRLARTRH